MDIEELQAIRDDSDENKLTLAKQHQFEGGVDEINAWLDKEIAHQQEESIANE